MREKMKTKTVVHAFETPLERIQIVATLPIDNSEKKIPISISIGGSEGLACYYYAIPYRDEVVGTIMVDDADDARRDMARQLATSIAKRYHRPCYIAYACTIDDQLLITKQCIEFLKLHI